MAIFLWNKEEARQMDKRLTTNANLKVDQDKLAPDSQQDDQGQAQDKQQSNKIEGYALMFNQPSKDLGGFVEVIDPKALDGVDLSNVIMLDQHDYSKPLASVKAGTLQLDVDDKGFTSRPLLILT